MSLRRVALAFIVSFSCIGASAPAPHFSLDAVLSAPYIAELAASPDGTTIAYVAHERGLRNVYVARDGVAKRVTAFDGDDGEEIGGLAFSHDGGALTYTRGGGYNRDGEVPNPRSIPDPPDKAIWVTDTHGGAPIRAGVGSSPYLAPDGSRLIFASRGMLKSEMLTWEGATLKSLGKPETLLTIRGNIRDERFAPDGSKLAFSNGRGDHGFVVIYDFDAKSYVYATPAFDQDYAPAWSPDSKRVAFVRLPGDREEADPYVDVPEAPWEIWVANATTGDAHRAFRAWLGRGQEFYNLDANDQLFWLADGTIVFPWERSGWRQLWGVSANGGNARALMHGDFESESAVASVDGSRVDYATNEGDIDHRHIWSVGSNGVPHQVTSGASDQWFPAALAGGGVAYVDAGWKTVPTVIVRLASGATVALGPNSGSYPSDAVVQPEMVTFRSTDGLLLHGEVFVPNDGKRKHCGVVFTHGGSERQMLPGFHYMEAYANLYETNQYIANRGCVVVSINYRGGIMYGHDFREAKHKGERGGVEYLDLMGGTRYLLSRADVDPKRVGIYGLSYGGYITALGLARHSDIFKVGFDMAGVHNWATIMDSDYGRPVGSPAERKIAYDASPVAAIATWASPVFLAQGDDDRNVPFSQGEDLALRLRAKGVEVRTAVFPNETHEMTLAYRDSMAMFGGGLQFLLSHLGE
ncbi:MAG: prolyl oligopeptidase family serine peptidase [Candidatus Eremiobacteraeota bacterium]|nr:prolyl oligopeptidase family serine peptidase [Candidatus Eremiobacteraeota bacterium]